ncbi:MAG: LON peptidase substrate-binding domain-containing protein, partial [Microthrixaceae bacterium]
MTVTPMFPLGTVVLPGMPLPLRIFEERYQQMLVDVMAGDRTFGVVLIERGSEVGGGDFRSDVGTLVRIVRHQPMADGHQAIVVIGIERIRVEHWLPDAPYPCAEVSVWPEETQSHTRTRTQTAPGGSTDGDPDTSELGSPDTVRLYRSCTRDLRHLLATAVELGHQVAPSTFEIPDDPVAGSYLLASLTPVGPFDKQRLLKAPGVDDRLLLLRKLVVDQLD